MAKALKQVEKESRMLSVIQGQIENQRKSAETAQMMLNEIRSIHRDVNEVRGEVSKRFGEMEEMVQEVRDSVTLTNAECSMIHSAVASKSIQLTKDRYDEETDSFKKVVGVHRRMIWKQLKERYDVPKYNCIRRIDFDEAVRFVNDFRPEDYL